MSHPRFRLGLRTLKTALAVMIAMFLASLLGTTSIFPALSAIAVMSRSFDEGLRECRNQAVGILIGGIFGIAVSLLCPEPPIWAMSLGVMSIIFVCASIRVVFSCGLACAIFIVACLTEPSMVIPNTLTRVVHTAIGLTTGLVINYAVLPYNNSKKIYALLQELVDSLPSYLEQRIYQGLCPLLDPMDQLIDRLEYELTIYRHQRFLNRKHQQEQIAYFGGCLRLSHRIQRELAVLCALDTPGQPDSDCLRQLDALGLRLPETGIPISNSDPAADVVLNYHLHKLLDARRFLQELLDQRTC